MSEVKALDFQRAASRGNHFLSHLDGNVAVRRLTGAISKLLARSDIRNKDAVAAHAASQLINGARNCSANYYYYADHGGNVVFHSGLSAAIKSDGSVTEVASFLPITITSSGYSSEGAAPVSFSEISKSLSIADFEGKHTDGGEPSSRGGNILTDPFGMGCSCMK